MNRKNDSLQILIASGVRGDTRRYRTFHLYEQCRLLGLDVRLSHVMEPGFQKMVDASNLLILHRAEWDSNVQRAIDKVHQKGGKIIYDTDDLLFDQQAFAWIDSPDFADPVRAGLYRETMNRYRRTMQSCGAIITSTDYLAGQAKGFDRPVYIHRNGFSNEMMAISSRIIDQKKRGSGNIILGYASGTPTHDRDFETIGPVLRALLAENSALSLWLIGSIRLNREWGGLKKQLVKLPHVPWRMLPGYLAYFDINLAPLVIDNPFAQSKSEIKWMEAALVKVPTVASPSDAFSHAIRNGVSGVLAITQDEWHNSLSKLIDDGSLRQAIGRAAYDQVIHDYGPLSRAQQLLSILQQLSYGKITKFTSVELPELKNRDFMFQKNENSPNLLTMGIYSLRFRGLLTLSKQVWIVFRRLVSPIIPYRKSRSNNGTKENGNG